MGKRALVRCVVHRTIVNLRLYHYMHSLSRRGERDGHLSRVSRGAGVSFRRGGWQYGVEGPISPCAAFTLLRAETMFALYVCTPCCRQALHIDNRCAESLRADTVCSGLFYRLWLRA